MKIKCAYTKLEKLENLKQHPSNRNNHPEKQIKALAKIIAKIGMRSPIVVSNLSGFIVKGHGRLEALKLLGEKEAPVDYQDYESELEEFNDRIADNEISRYAEFDKDGFAQDLKDFKIEDPDFEEFGLIDFEPAIEVIEGKCDEDEVPEVVTPITRRGDIWILGNHRLMCGDSTMIDEVEKLMKGEKADMVFTDPPYGVSYTGGLADRGNGLESNKREMIKNDDIDLYYDAVVTASYFSNGVVFMFYADTVPFELYRGVKEVEGKVVALLVWKKIGGYGAMGCSYKPNHEPCLVWLPKGKKLNFIGATNENRIWELKKEGVNKLHPTQKPVEIPKRAISNHDAKVVLDIFGGSGSTLIACEELKREARLMELDEKYCDVIINRWQNFTGRDDVVLESTGEKYNEIKKTKKAVLESTGKSYDEEKEARG